MEILRFFKTGVAHQILLCYLIGDEGSACPTSDLIIAGPDRSALLFYFRNL